MYSGDKKNQIKQLWKKSTFGIRKKIFLLNFVFALLLMLSLSMGVYNIVANYLRTESNNYVHKLGQQINNSIDTYLEEMKKTIPPSLPGLKIKLHS